MQKIFSKVRHRRCNIPKKLSQCDQSLLELMCLRLGLLNEDLAEKKFEFHQRLAHIYLQHESKF